MSWTWVALLCACSAVGHGGKVLVFPVDGSHWINMRIILEELHSRGHQVTVVRQTDSWYIKEAPQHYSLITIDVESGFDENFMESFVYQLLEIQREGKSIWTRLKLEMDQSQKVAEFQLKSAKGLQRVFENKTLLESFQKGGYDVVLTDPALPWGVILGAYLKLPLVFNVRWTSQGEGHLSIAPSPVSYVPMLGTQLSDKMTFFERVLNVIVSALTELQIAKIIVPPYEDLVEKYFGPDVDYLSLFQVADLWLMRVDFVFEFPRPTMPNVIYMAGFQSKPPRPLPQHLEEFVQSSKEHGVIIMSLGTLVGDLPGGLAEVFAGAFAKLPQKVIWRYKGLRPANVGNNTLVVDWMPQNDLLGHPQIKLFVAHGGTNGIQEALYHGVPILGIPLVFDQHDNLHRIEVRGAGKTIHVAMLSKDTFLQGIQEMLAEPSYRTNMQRLSRLHRDVPMKPLDTAIFWIEYVMRHKGAAHLKAQSYGMSWSTYHSVDVVLFLLGIALAIIGVFVLLLKCLFTVCLKNKKGKTKRKRN